MSLETIYYIGQTIAVLALIVSLFFVGVQIRQNTEQSKVAAADAAHRSFLDWYYNQSPDTAANFVSAQQGYQSFTAEERFLFFANGMPLLINLQEAHAKLIDGSLAPDRWRFWDHIAQGISISPPMQIMWEERRFTFTDVFQDYFDEKIKSQEGFPETAASWVAQAMNRGEVEPKTPSSKEPDA